MALLKKTKGRAVRYSVRLFTKMVPSKVLQEWKEVVIYTGGKTVQLFLIMSRQKTEHFLGLRFFLISLQT